MLVQYEAPTPPSSINAWSQQGTQGSRVLIFLAWLGLAVGACGALYWAHLSVLGAIYGTVDWPGYVWLALTAAGAAIIAPIMWPFLETRRERIANFVLVVGIISWLITSASGALYQIAKSERVPATLENAPRHDIGTQFNKDNRSVFEAQDDCWNGIWRGCDWLDSHGARQIETRIKQYDAELWRRQGLKPEAVSHDMADVIRKLRKKFALFLTVALGGSIALAMVWGPAEALKAMHSEPDPLLSAKPVGVTEDGLPIGGMGNPVDMAFESWSAQCLERARGERTALSVLHAHYMGWCMQRGMPTYASDAAFGRALNRSRDLANPNDLGGPMVRLGAFPLKSGGQREYSGVRVLPDNLLDEIEAADEV